MYIQKKYYLGNLKKFTKKLTYNGFALIKSTYIANRITLQRNWIIIHLIISVK